MAKREFLISADVDAYESQSDASEQRLRHLTAPLSGPRRAIPTKAKTLPQHLEAQNLRHLDAITLRQFYGFLRLAGVSSPLAEHVYDYFLAYALFHLFSVFTHGDFYLSDCFPNSYLRQNGVQIPSGFETQVERSVFYDTLMSSQVASS
ncbi:hypothetical protein C8J57DRAFT_1507439 [Mycena rebaudengoi]|nr:hypothetical protein C8J57DRAFT_1507439 [Mycena rebaudengoi]